MPSHRPWSRCVVVSGNSPDLFPARQRVAMLPSNPLISSSSQWSLKLSPFASCYPFVNTPFDLSIHLLDNHTQLLKGGEEILLRIELLTQDTDGVITQTNENYLEIDIKNPMIPTSGTLTIPVTINETSMNAGNKKFLLQVSSVSHENVAPVVSIPLFVVTHRLILPDPFPSLWYKDQGGKNNWLKLPIRLVNNKNQNVLNRRVYLSLTLYYENGTIVPRQEILNVGNQTVIGDPGHATIMFRIEEVSRSHQNQNFVIKISPDVNKDPKCNDISTIETTPIHVMSKSRTKDNGHTSGAPQGQLLRKRGREENEEKFEQATAVYFPPPSNIVEWSQLAVQELFVLRSKVDYLIQCFQQSLNPQLPLPMISVDPTQTSLLIPPHYPPDLYHRPQISLATDTDKGNDFTVKKQKSATFTNESIEDSELLLTLHRQMYRQIPLPHPPKDQAEDDISLTDLPSELIRQGLDDTVNMKDSVGEWRDR